MERGKEWQGSSLKENLGKVRKSVGAGRRGGWQKARHKAQQVWERRRAWWIDEPKAAGGQGKEALKDDGDTLWAALEDRHSARIWFFSLFWWMLSFVLTMYCVFWVSLYRHTPIVSGLRRCEQEDGKFESSRDYIAHPRHCKLKRPSSAASRSPRRLDVLLCFEQWIPNGLWHQQQEVS